MTTILKLHSNGVFETVGVTLNQSEIPGNYSFDENIITVPKIIEYPPPDYQNLFIEKTSESGWLDLTDGTIRPAYEYDRSTDFIPVVSGSSYTICLRYKNLQSSDYQAWVTGYYYNAQRQFISAPLDVYSVPESATGEQSYLTTLTPPANVAFIRYSFNLYDHPRVDLKVSIERATQAMSTVKHYLAFEDMPEWVVDTRQPISIFPQGIVIKGALIQSNSY